MEHKEAIKVLMKLLDKKVLDKKEKEAVLTSIGILDWTSRTKNRIKLIKDKKERDLKW
ncbi:MAG: hypothetical protein PHF44_01650 [Candidatus Pacebacteria bacterium]|nr:hypothetical protein [Candidatus Paceibacterota bacterium]